MLRLFGLLLASVIIPVAIAQDVKIPPGTLISVRTIDKIDSQSAQPGKTFKAVLADPLTVNGAVVAAAGSDAQIKIIETKRAGRLTGKAELAITLTSIAANGLIVPITTEDTTSSSAGKARVRRSKPASEAASAPPLEASLEAQRELLSAPGLAQLVARQWQWSHPDRT